MSNFTPNVRVTKCQCADPVCKSYHISSSSSGMFSLEDAQLYAAAPDLLDALKGMLADNPSDNAFSIAHDAIKKAEGK